MKHWRCKLFGHKWGRMRYMLGKGEPIRCYSRCQRCSVRSDVAATGCTKVVS